MNKSTKSFLLTNSWIIIIVLLTILKLTDVIKWSPWIMFISYVVSYLLVWGIIKIKNKI